MIRLPLRPAAWLAGLAFFLEPAAAQLNTVPFPRDQIALQLGALQRGYTTAGTPFNPTDRQQAANAWLQGRIALANSNGWGRNNVLGATQPTSYGDQLDAAVLAVLAAPSTNVVRGRVIMANGERRAVDVRLRLPSPAWFVPMPYALDALSAAATGPGGSNNTVAGQFSWIGGGQGNVASTNYALVNAGENNTAAGIGAAVGGGAFNTATGGYASVGGGYANTNSGEGAAVGSGGMNSARGIHATVGGGSAHSASGQASFIGGGNCTTPAATTPSSAAAWPTPMTVRVASSVRA